MELNISTSLLALIVIVFLIGISFKRFFNRFPLSIPPRLLSPSSLNPIKELLLFLVTNRETQRRLLITVGVLIVSRLLAYIPLPGINQGAFTAFFSGFLDRSGLLARFSILSLGIMPFFSSCLLIQLLSVVVPHLRRATFGGEEGRYKIVRYTYLLTIGLALVHSYGISVWLDSGANIVTMPNVLFRVVATMTLTAACFLLLFLADIINKYGIGNGIAMLVISGLLQWVWTEIKRYWYLLHENMIESSIVVLIIAIIIGSLLLAFFFTSRERKIFIKGKRGQGEFTIPLRISWVADGPLELSGMILAIPWVIASFIKMPWANSIGHYLVPHSVQYIIIGGILLFFCTFFYASIIFQPSYIKNLMQKYNFSAKEIEDKELTDYLDTSLSRILVITFILLFVIPMISMLINSLLPVDNKGIAVFVGGGAGLLVFVGVFFDILSQLEFFYQKNKKPKKKFAIAYVAFDEIEARIKSEYLKGKKIDALVEPLRFTWGIPIRTAIDQYRIYVPEKEVAKARKLIE